MTERKKYVVSSGGSKATVMATSHKDAFNRFINKARPDFLGILTEMVVDGVEFWQMTTTLLKATGRKVDDK